MQAETPDTCAICQESVTDDFAYPCEHTLHAECASRWFHSQIVQGMEMTCPVCRRPAANGWRTMELRSPTEPNTRTAFPVGPDTTIKGLKEQLSWSKGVPPNVVTLFTEIPLNETTKLPLVMNNRSWVGPMRELFIYDSFLYPEFLNLNLPKGPSATDKMYVCPLSRSLLLNPTQAADGFVYERAAIVRWVQTKGNTSPKVPGRPIQPLATLINPAFDEAVRAIQTVPPRPMTADLTKEITVNVIRPQMQGECSIRVRYSDKMISIAKRAVPNGRRLQISTGDGVLYDTAAFTVAQAYVEDGATLYVINMG